MDEVRQLYWQEKISVIQLQKLSATYWQESWSIISDCLFALTDFKSYHDFILMVLIHVK